MAKVSGTASLGVRIGLAHKKQFGSHDGATPFYAMTIEREGLSDNLSDEELADKAEDLMAICRKRVEKKINPDIADLQKPE